jgi:hypothetical protein
MKTDTAEVVGSFVTRYDVKMPSSRRKQPATAADRMRRYRARNKAAGLSEQRRWVSPPGSMAPFSDHTLHDIRSLAMHAVIAQKLLRQPRLVKVAQRNLVRWLAANPEAAAFHEWASILSRPLPDILALITSTSEEATRLRQSSPFAGVLGPAERERFFAAFRP